jgi:transposase-like protein
MAGKITGKSQKGQQIPEMSENQAREHIEKLLWPDGQPVCRHCGSTNAYRMQGATCRPGLCRCRDCQKQFTVTVGTIFEDTHLPLAMWVKAFHLMASSKKGMSALQLQRNLGIGSYKSAWFMAHRIRHTMKCDPMAGALRGEVQVDETYVGGKPRPHSGQPRTTGRGTRKQPVVVLVETNGNAHAKPVQRVTARHLKRAIRETVDPSATIVSDEFGAYRGIGEEFDGGHKTVNHSAGEYIRDGFHTNTAESFFALLKRGHYGVYHQMSKKHLHRYCDEFSFRWNGRKMEDAERRTLAIQQVEGKRLMYKTPVANISIDLPEGW